MPLTQVDQGLLGQYAQYTGFKNRLINGQMVIDQRNAGAAWGTSINGYTVDRWQIFQSVTGKLNGGQNYNNITPPAGFTKYIGVQSQSAYTVGANDYYFLQQVIEAYNMADFGFGTSSAQPVTLSFWVRSSLTGTFGLGFTTYNDNGNTFRGYTATYTINAANTWEYKTVTVPGDVGGSGTWQTGTGIGLRVNFALGVGSTYSQATGSWGSSNTIGATGAVSVVGTNGATFYITGVQLEKGSTATSFDYRPYGTELVLCQRYFWKFGDMLAACISTLNGVGTMRTWLSNPVQMRAAPTGTTNITGYGAGANQIRFYINGFLTNSGFSIGVDYSGVNTVSFYVSGMTSGTVGQAASTDFGSGSYIYLSAEL